jgi:leader peptidase (prepilin peptidase) / N-methyltransferase
VYTDPLFRIYITVSGLLFGAVIGSFLNVVIWRLPRGESIAFPGSHCPKCDAPIAWYDNIPILAWLFLSGKCRDCQEPISARYPAIELISGVAFAASVFHFGLVQGLVWYVFTAALLVVTMVDLDHKIIPNEISLPGIPIGLALHAFVLARNWQDGLINGGLGILLGGGLLLSIALGYLALTKREGMGMGDPKLLGMIGAFVGWKGVVFTLLVSSLTGTVIGLLFMAIGGKDRRWEIPFGPFLSLGAVLWIWIGPATVKWYLGY